MKRGSVIGIIAGVAAIIIAIILVGWYLKSASPMLIQGTVECTTYKASSKIAGRIDDMKEIGRASWRERVGE